MEPLQWIRELSKQNPQSAILLLGSIAAFAAVATIGGFGIDLKSRIPSVLFLIGIGALLLIVTSIVNNKLMMTTLAWFIVLMSLGWILVFIVSRLNPSPSLVCVVRFWDPCVITADEIAISASKAARPLLAPATPQSVPSDTNVQRGNYKVFVQFAGALKRQDVRGMMEQLRKAGWNVQGVDGGGQRTGTAAGANEVRYRDNSDVPAAQMLAHEVQIANLVSRVITEKPVSSIEKGNLEVWISR